jgi:hypothetical protein
MLKRLDPLLNTDVPCALRANPGATGHYGITALHHYAARRQARRGNSSRRDRAACRVKSAVGLVRIELS